MSHFVDKNCSQIEVGLPRECFQTLAGILEQVFPIRFKFGGETGAASVASILNAAPPEPLISKAEAHGANLVVPVVPPVQGAALTEIQVRFSGDEAVPFPFRGRTLKCKVANLPVALNLVAGEKALLTAEQGVLWSQTQVGGVTVFRSAFALPEIPASGNLHDVLNGDRFLEMLPLLHFLRMVTGHYSWQRPPVRAQFMFDDPNLHWPTYGLVDYQELAARAKRENYHVSFATVPLDAWYTNRRTAALFREQSEQLSLCIHGNDHTKRELAQAYSPAQRIALLQQAISRIERLEQGSGVAVSRVMVPPHGACSHEMLGEIPGSGFESACISHGSLRSHNRQRSWTASLGYHPVSVIAGCPVLPRWGFVGTTENTILLAAYLDQALVLRGHHQDLKDGIELLDEFARVINGLGAVQWGSMTDISRKSYYSIQEQDTLRLRPWVHRISCRNSAGLRRIAVEDPTGSFSGSWRLISVNGIAMSIAVREVDLLAQIPEGQMIFEQAPAPSLGAKVKRPIPATAFARRVLTEGRDRLQGWLGRKQA